MIRKPAMTKWMLRRARRNTKRRETWQSGRCPHTRGFCAGPSNPHCVCQHGDAAFARLPADSAWRRPGQPIEEATP